MNPFNINDIVNTIHDEKTGGLVKHVACKDALKSNGSTCNKNSCSHSVKEHVWVSWPNSKSLFAYHYPELKFNHVEQTTTHVPMSADSEKRAISKINEFISTKEEKPFDSKQYNGFVKIRRDINGSVIPTDATQESAPLQDDEIDFNAYNGFVKGPVRKAKKP